MTNESQCLLMIQACETKSRRNMFSLQYKVHTFSLISDQITLR